MPHRWSRLFGPRIRVVSCVLTLLLAALVLLEAVSAQSHPSTRSRGASSRPGSQPGETAPTGPPGVAQFGPFSFQPPADWKTKAVPNDTRMRRAAYALPAADGDREEGELIVFYFGPGNAGSVEANLHRWKRQMIKPEGISDAEHAVISKQTVDGIPVTIAEIRGDYDPGAQLGGGRRNGFMMLAAIVEAPGGAYYLRTLGPEKTILKHRTPWYTMVLQLKATSGASKPGKSTEKPTSRPTSKPARRAGN